MNISVVNVLCICLYAAINACCREIDEKSLLMKISLPIDKDTLLNYNAIQYKYVVEHSDRKSTWEFVPRKVTSGDFANRILSVPREKIQQQITGV